MKYSMLYIPTLLLAISLINISCKKENGTNNTTPTNTRMLLSKLTDGSGIMTFVYDSSARLKSYSMSFSSGYSTYNATIDQYDVYGNVLQETMVSSIGGANSSVTVYKFWYTASNQLDSMYSIGNGFPYMTAKYSYSGNTITVREKNSSGLVSVKLITLTADGKNVLSVAVTGAGSPNYTVSYSGYDNKKNPSYYSFPVHKRGYSQNNPGTAITYRVDTNTTTTENYTYTYNSQGFPVNLTNSLSGNVSVYEYIER